MIYRNTLIPLAALLVLWHCGCTKSSSTRSTVTTTADSAWVDSVLYRGTAYAGVQLSFSYGMTSGTLAIQSMLWDFGDGSTSGNPNYPEHAYAAAGTYTVTLHVNNYQVSRSITVQNDPLVSNYISRMAGTRHWTGTADGYISEFTLPGAINSTVTIDTSLAVLAVNNSVIQFPFSTSGTTLYLTTVDTTQQTLSFTNGLPVPVFVTYYYSKDSMVYSDIWYATEGHRSEELIIHSP